jgi:hypothetical protein
VMTVDGGMLEQLTDIRIGAALPDGITEGN